MSLCRMGAAYPMGLGFLEINGRWPGIGRPLRHTRVSPLVGYVGYELCTISFIIMTFFISARQGLSLQEQLWDREAQCGNV